MIKKGDYVYSKIHKEPKSKLLVEQVKGDWIVCYNTDYIGTDIVGRYNLPMSMVYLAENKPLGVKGEHTFDSIKKVEQISIFDL